MSSSFRLVGDGNSLEEGIASFLCGMLFGATTVVVGHPLDTVKTRMQADAAFRGLGTYQSIAKIGKDSGILGFYRGAIPPLVGSTFFRSIQFAAYGATFAAFRDEQSRMRLWTVGGVEARVFLGGAVAGLARSLIESPLDFIKTRQQTSTSVVSVLSCVREIPFQQLARGFSATLTRNVLLLTTFFVIIDKLSGWSSSFTRGGVATTTAWTLVWPLDVVKSQMQAGSSQKGMQETLIESFQNGTMYRGYSAGIARSFFANGASLYVYQWGQRMREKLQRA